MDGLFLALADDGDVVALAHDLDEAGQFFTEDSSIPVSVAPRTAV